jgi:hypothetical protein
MVAHYIPKLLGVAIVLGAGFAAYHFLFGRGWLSTSVCFLVWFLLASLYKPSANGPG